MAISPRVNYTPNSSTAPLTDSQDVAKGALLRHTVAHAKFYITHYQVANCFISKVPAKEFPIPHTILLSKRATRVEIGAFAIYVNILAALRLCYG
jgi:hypothetical protein